MNCEQCNSKDLTLIVKEVSKETFYSISKNGRATKSKVFDDCITEYILLCNRCFTSTEISEEDGQSIIKGGF